MGKFCAIGYMENKAANASEKAPPATSKEGIEDHNKPEEVGEGPVARNHPEKKSPFLLKRRKNWTRY